MGQNEVLEILNKNGGWMTAREIHKSVTIRYNGLVALLRKLIKWGFVEKRYLKGNIHLVEYRKI